MITYPNKRANYPKDSFSTNWIGTKLPAAYLLATRIGVERTSERVDGKFEKRVLSDLSEERKDSG
jgi:hypothetical protein